ncbi:MAG: asparagine synthetase B, partial [Candidatus Competibacteraceae bacterium]|nr:asparagine synthetase B [Candidatus Competibacteraceae bacterium]
MCGIAGLYRRQGQTDPTRLVPCTQALHHRGPDEEGVWFDGPCAIAHTRLSIIDLAGGHQPLTAHNGDLVLVANGEIYNFIELRRDLEARGHRFSSHSDSETILHAYAEWGLDLFERLCGMYAFALYDRSCRRLLLARDRLGIKPLFLAETAEGLAFASELKALLPLLPGKPRVNPSG